MFNKRCALLEEKLNNNEWIYIKNPENMYYYSSFSGEGALLISKEERIIITDFRYVYDAKRASEYGYRVYDIAGGLENAPRKCPGLIYIEEDCVTVKGLNALKKCFPEAKFMPEDFLKTPRRVKSEEEIRLIQKASSIAEAAFLKLLKIVSSEVSEKDLANEFSYLVKKEGADDISFDTIVASGINSSMPHAVPTDKKIMPGDFITFDFGCKVGGYSSDMTRTVAYKYATDEMKNVYDIVLKAQKEGLKNAKAGMLCRDVDKSARDIIDSFGYKKEFGHALGHGVGLFVHEEPSLSMRSDLVLEDNMVVTIEPGIYIEDKFGVRIEDLVVINGENPQILTKFEKNLIII